MKTIIKLNNLHRQFYKTYEFQIEATFFVLSVLMAFGFCFIIN